MHIISKYAEDLKPGDKFIFPHYFNSRIAGKVGIVVAILDSTDPRLVFLKEPIGDGALIVSSCPEVPSGATDELWRFSVLHSDKESKVLLNVLMPDLVPSKEVLYTIDTTKEYPWDVF